MTCQRRAPAPLQDSVQASASLQPWTPSSTKRVRHCPSWAVFCFSLSQLDLSIHLIGHFPVNMRGAFCLPPSFLSLKSYDKKQMFVLGFQQLYPVQSLTIYIWLFFFSTKATCDVMDLCMRNNACVLERNTAWSRCSVFLHTARLALLVSRRIFVFMFTEDVGP